MMLDADVGAVSPVATYGLARGADDMDPLRKKFEVFARVYAITVQQHEQ